jgi:hypothetical protein
MSRDLAAERELLTEAGGPDFAAAAIARIDASEPEYGTSFAYCARALLWRELDEEALDLSCWACLAERRATLDGMDPQRLARLRALLLSIARHGAQARTLIAEARRLAEAAPDAERAA